MLKKNQRATTKDIKDIFNQGKYLSFGNLGLKYITQKKSTKIAFSVPKNSMVNSVQRNLLRRRGYAQIKELISELPQGFMGVFIYGKNAMQFFGGKNKQESKKALKQAITTLIKKI